MEKKFCMELCSSFEELKLVKCLEGFFIPAFHLGSLVNQGICRGNSTCVLWLVLDFRQHHNPGILTDFSFCGLNLYLQGGAFLVFTFLSIPTFLFLSELK